MLLLEGADINARSNVYGSALYAAESQSTSLQASLVEGESQSTTSPPTSAVWRSNVAHMLREEGAVKLEPPRFSDEVARWI